ncbi:MAG: acetyltransferase [Bacteroidetes bacterium]|nr:MAG: acetyltransferase [Bacteroidota bacterium]
MDIAAYLQRIQYSGILAPTLPVLQALQKQHLLHVPFENLDIHAHKKIVLDTGRIFNKIVLNRRGGFCYELNGLFYALLQEAGFASKRISGRVYDKEKGYGEEFDHLAILTTIGPADYLVDVGFGEFVFHPLRLEAGLIQQDERGTFRIDRYDGDYYRVSKLVGGEAVPQYIFTTRERQYREFEAMCTYHQTSPDSHFTQKRFLGIPVPNGRITLAGNTLKIVTGDTVREQEIGEAEFRDVLVRYFQFSAGT